MPLFNASWPRSVQLTALLCALLAPAFANSASTHAACLQAQGNDLLGQVQCGTAEIKRRQAQIASAYKKASVAVRKAYGNDHPMVGKLKDNQAAWEQYRDTLCSLRIGRGGLWAALAANECDLEMQQQRIEWLNNGSFD